MWHCKRNGSTVSEGSIFCEIWKDTSHIWEILQLNPTTWHRIYCSTQGSNEIPGDITNSDEFYNEKTSNKHWQISQSGHHKTGAPKGDKKIIINLTSGGQYIIFT